MRAFIASTLLILGSLVASASVGKPLDSVDGLSKGTASNDSTLVTPLPIDEGEAESGSDESRPSAGIYGDSAIAIGDRLKVTIFLEYGSGNGLSTTNQGALPAILERQDLSGEYTVDESGTLFLPLAGPLEATGHSLPELTALIEKAYARQQEAPIRASVQLLERQPVYVTGNIPSPAVLKHTPGMTVLQAALLAGAGGNTLAGDRTQRQLDVTRERERVRQSAERLAKCLARRAVLVAERDGHQPRIPLSLSRIAEVQPDTVLEDAVRLRKKERQKVDEEISGLDSTFKGMESELTLLRDNARDTEAWVEELQARVQGLEPAFKKGTVNSMTMFTARNDLVNAQERLQEIKTNISRLERDIMQTRASKSQLLTNETFEQEKALQEVEDAIHQEEITQSTMGLLTQTASFSTMDNLPLARPKYRIVRQTPDGLKEFDAGDDSGLQPGDILKIINVLDRRLSDERP